MFNMKKWIEFHLADDMDTSLLERIDGAFHNDNLTETILHLHLLIERALTTKIASKLIRSETWLQGQWTFHQKMSLYIALFDPERDAVDTLRGFNKLRNEIAHDFGNLEELVMRCLPIKGGYDGTALDRVRTVGGGLLLFHLGALKSAKRLDVEGETSN
jgi:hypothetical protein